jgi:ankyrin repeat protein
LEDVHNYYSFSNSQVFIVWYSSNFHVSGDKGVTDELVFLHEITRDTIQEVICAPQYKELMAANMAGVIKLCAARGESEMVRWLLRRCNINPNLDAALLVASEGGHADTVALLIEKGAYVQASDNYALRHASVAGHLRTVALLLESGADVHAGNGAALFLACTNGHLSVAKLLLEHGADVHANNNAALRAAKVYGYSDLMALLRGKGATLGDQ